MVKARKSTWRSGGGWWDSPPVSRHGYLGDEVGPPSEEDKERLKKRKRPRLKSAQAKARGAQELLRLQKLALRARSNMIARPDEAERICREALQTKPQTVLKYRERSGKPYLRVFTELLEEAERSSARKKSRVPRTPKSRGGQR